MQRTRPRWKANHKETDMNRWMLATMAYGLVTGLIAGVVSLGPTASAQTPAQNGSRGIALYGDSAYEGFSQAIEDIYLGSEDLGRIIELPVRVGDRVKAGEVIAKLDDEIEKASMEIARIQASMVGEVQAAEASADMQRTRVQHLRRLSADQMAGSEELRRSEMELAIAEARVTTAKEQQQLRAAEAKRLQLQWERRTIRAPFDAVVAEKKIGVGATITPTDPEIVRLIRTDVLHGVFNVLANQAIAMRPGMKAEVYFRAARRTVDAVVDTVGPNINGESGTTEVRVRIENPNGDLRPGDRCTMRLVEGEPDAKPSVSRRPAPTSRTGASRW